MPSAPSLPTLEGVRLATPDDLVRIATVAAAGYFHSPTFQYQRIHHAAFPDDTLCSYLSEYQKALVDRAIVVLVAEDILEDAEDEDVYPALRNAAAYSQCVGSMVSKVVVGVASIAMKPGSPYIGQFQPKCPVDLTRLSTIPSTSNRDFCQDRVRIYNEATAPAKTRHLAGEMRLSTLAVHPTYWRRGHATRLVSWCTRLADLDGVSVGISAVPRGAMIAVRAGFEGRELVKVERTGKHGEKPSVGSPQAELWVAIRRPSGSPTSGDSASSLESR